MSLTTGVLETAASMTGSGGSRSLLDLPVHPRPKRPMHTPGGENSQASVQRLRLLALLVELTTTAEVLGTPDRLLSHIRRTKRLGQKSTGARLLISDGCRLLNSIASDFPIRTT